MRRAFGIGALILTILVGVAIGVGAYHAGVTHGLAQAAGDGRVVRVIGPEYGFFPFGLFLFPLFFFLVFGLARGLFWRRRWGGPGPWGPGHHPEHWSKEGPAMFEEWHRHQHEKESGTRSGPESGPVGV